MRSAGTVPVRACLVSFQFWPRVGGAEAQAEKQARQMQALGHEVIVVTLRHEKRWQRIDVVNGLQVVRVGGIYKRSGTLRLGRLGHVPIDIGMFFTLWRLRRRYDIMHVFQVSPVAAVAALIGQLAHKPVVVSVQSTGPGDAQRARIEQGVTLMADTLESPGASDNKYSKPSSVIGCHPERSEGSGSPGTEILRCTQDDIPDGGRENLSSGERSDLSFLNIDFIDVASASGDLSYLPQTAFGGNVILKYLRNSDAFYQVLSHRGYPYLTSRGFRAKQIVRISNGIDASRYHPEPALRPDSAGPDRDIVCVARMDYAKGVDVLVHAWSRMMRAPAEWRAELRPRLRLVGDGVLMRQMQSIVTELGIQDSVEFLGLRADVVDLLRQAWAFVLPSRWEGMPNALLEAMACGLPCVATRVSGSEDVIANGINGLLVEPEQPAEMALALRRVIEDTALAHQLGQQAVATVLREYQLPTIVEQCLSLYRCLLAKEKRALPLGLERNEIGR
ncbi:MAG TPA: glycosyltransferase family 4 protein [Ktedonobacteraceae bacterium]|nr:glycosyltransferase family 4 protein [Ktedonobacteraceae bacterium]